MGSKLVVVAAMAMAGLWGGLAAAGGGAFIEAGHDRAPASFAQPARSADEQALDALLDSVVQELDVTGGAPDAEASESAPPAPTPPPALSVLEADGEGCLWVRVELPGGARKVMASLPVSCAGLSAASDGRGGSLLWSSGSLMLVDPQGRVSELPLPKKGDIVRAGFDGTASVVGLTWQEVRPRTDGRGPHVLYRGKRIDFGDVPAIGVLGLVHAFRWDGEKWLEVETKASNGEACDTRGVDVLEAAKAIEGPRGTLDLLHRSERVSKLPALEEIAASDGEGQWRALPVTEGHAFAWLTGDDLLHETGLVAFEKDQRISTLDTELDGTGQAHLEVAGAYVLVAAREDGEEARVFDARTGRAVYQASGRAAFWPRSAAVEP